VSSSGNRQAGRLAGLVRRHRRRAGLTQQQAAESAGISVAGLRDLEQGRVAAPRPGTLRRLATALGVSEAERAELLRAAQPGGTGLYTRILGPLALTVDDTPVDLGSESQRTLLGLLALSPNLPISRDTLIDAAWGAVPPANAVDLLQTHMSRLRRRLTAPHAPASGNGFLVNTRGGYQLTTDDDHLDLLMFRKLVTAARRAHDEAGYPAACEAYQQALALWRGEPLADISSLHGHPALVALGREWQTVILEYAATAAELGRHEQVLAELRRLTDVEPLHEAAHAHLMIALAGVGQQAEALRVYEQLRHRLADELGADPGPELAAAHRQVLRQEITRPETTPVSAHRQLPPDIAEFTGRTDELANLHHSLPAAGVQHTASVLYAIEGMAGVGKTRLAVHFAHQLLAADRYREVQLYVDLHGHADEPPADPANVLGSFLRLLGLAGSQIPQDLAARAALYRDRLHDKHALVLLDNAADEDQVLPLLPAGPTNLVLITSRRTLAVDGAHTLPLDLFTPYEAQVLLAEIAGEGRAADAEAARQVVELCGRHPLAVSLAARRLQARPTWQLADLANRIQQAGHRLDELVVGGRQLRAVFELSYRAIDREARRVFRLLGVHPGDDFTEVSVAPLAGLSPRTTRRILDQLIDEHLVTMSTSDRYRLHDLVREYAAEKAYDADREPGTREALNGLLEWYLHAVDEARHVLFPHLVDIDLDGWPRPAHLPRFADDEDAFNWLSAEHANLMAAVSAAVQLGRHDIAWRLPVALKHYLERASAHDDWLRTGQTALLAARRAGDRAGEAAVLNFLGVGNGQLGRIADALGHLTEAYDICRELGEPAGEAKVLINLGVAYGHEGRLAEAAENLEAALELGRELGDQYLQTRVLSNLGWVHTRLDQHDQAIKALREVLDISQRLGDPVGTVAAHHNLGEALLHAGEPVEAIPQLRQALELYQRKHFRLYEAEILEVLGDALLASGDRGGAERSWRQALAIFSELGHPHAGEVAARLDS
jgi:DNA-binding SARP family transcriptional activator/predicted negative regulator of RcsB-dependent stress response/DNA-binding XRE family transcriptional regulator